MNTKEMFEELRMQVSDVLDVDKNGTFNFRDFLAIFPNNAVAIAVILIDLLVAVAEIRVWDVGMVLTGGNWMLALGFVAVSAVPFYIGELLWLYPRANGIQQFIAGGMVLLSLYTSAQFGLADLTGKYDMTRLVQMVVWLSATYVLALIIYVFSDEAIKAHRLLKTTKAMADLETQRQRIVQGVLTTMKGTMEGRKQLEQMFGEGAVRDTLAHAKGRKPDRAALMQYPPAQPKPPQAPPATTFPPVQEPPAPKDEGNSPSNPSRQ